MIGRALEGIRFLLARYARANVKYARQTDWEMVSNDTMECCVDDEAGIFLMDFDLNPAEGDVLEGELYLELHVKSLRDELFPDIAFAAADAKPHFLICLMKEVN